jgi:hypothetical protein
MCSRPLFGLWIWLMVSGVFLQIFINIAFLSSQAENTYMLLCMILTVLLKQFKGTVAWDFYPFLHYLFILIRTVIHAAFAIFKGRLLLI